MNDSDSDSDYDTNSYFVTTCMLKSVLFKFCFKFIMGTITEIVVASLENINSYSNFPHIKHVFNDLAIFMYRKAISVIKWDNYIFDIVKLLGNS